MENKYGDGDEEEKKEDFDEGHRQYHSEYRGEEDEQVSSSQNVFTIPEASEKSQSVHSDDEQDYVIEEYENGSRFEGHKKDGKRNGHGKFYYQEGSFYDGQWKNNNMHGYGKLYYANGKIAYEGSWFNDQFHGHGKVYNDFPTPIEGSYNYRNFEELDERWKYY